MAKNRISKWVRRLVPIRSDHPFSWIRFLTAGSLYRFSDMRGLTSYQDIKTQIDTMRALARDSQISTALSYYATDATTTNSAGKIIWATAVDESSKDVAEVVNALFDRWNVSKYAYDQIIELATIGNLYIPTTYFYKKSTSKYSRSGVVLDNNTIPESDFDIVPAYKIPPETVLHLWYRGEPQGYILDPDDDSLTDNLVLMPELGIIHFTLGGLLGDYTITTQDNEGEELVYDIQFANPLMSKAVQPTQTLGLLEDAVLLSSLSRTIKFINVRVGNQEEEIRDALQQIKDAVEQQLALNTADGDVESFVNPQSPNNLIYLPFINDQEAISITDLNMAEASDADSKLLQYYQDKKLSVLGVPKEAMNFSSNEGLGGAGQVMSQRSALYANALQRLENAYMNGWTDAINKYFLARNMTGFVNKFQLHMNPIITIQSTVQSERRDSALGQAQTLIDLLKNIKVDEPETYRKAITEILSEVFPQMSADVINWSMDVSDAAEGGEMNAF